MKKITLTPQMVFWDGEWSRGDALERLFTLLYVIHWCCQAWSQLLKVTVCACARAFRVFKFMI